MSLELILEMVFHLAGGLGIFLLGMKYMQQGLQVIAGPKIREMINAVTANRFLAVGIGLAVTTLVQSSSVTSVMVIGLVNSQLMALEGAMGAMIGANIGTTITGWILALKIGKYGLPIIGAAAFGWLFLKKERFRYISLAVLGIGMIFFGLELMKDGFKPIRGMPEFQAWFSVFQATNYLGVLKAAAVGCILTVIVQSSSATLGITIALATTGVIDFQTAAALVLGENIGTTITAYLASLGTDDTNAKRVAYFHVMFNTIGVLWITAVFLPLYLPFIQNFVIGRDIILRSVDGNYPGVAAGIAAVHTGFNVANTVIFIFLLKPIAKMLTRLVKEDIKPPHKVTHLDYQFLDSPIAAIEQSASEIRRMEEHISTMMNDLSLVMNNEVQNVREGVIDAIFEREKMLDAVQIEVTTFLTDLLAESISHELAEEARSQLRLADEYESVSDYIMGILKSFLRLHNEKTELSSQQKAELIELHDMVSAYFEIIHTHDGDLSDWDYLKIIRQRSGEVTQKIRELRDRHWHRLSDEKVNPLISTSYMDIANGYRRIKDHLLNIGEAMSGGKELETKLMEADSQTAEADD